MKIELKDTTLAIISEEIHADGKYKEMIRIVRWDRNGRPGNPKLEKRSFVIQPNGMYQAGKLSGFTERDLITIFANAEKIKEFFAGIKIPKYTPPKETKDDDLVM